MKINRLELKDLTTVRYSGTLMKTSALVQRERESDVSYAAILNIKRTLRTALRDRHANLVDVKNLAFLILLKGREKRLTCIGS